MTISNLTAKHRVYPSLDYNGKPETYLNIRIVERQNRNKTVDIPIYKANGTRVKVLVKSFEDGRIKKGYYPDNETLELNNLIESLHRKIKDYCDKNPDAVSRGVIQEKIYGTEFIQLHKQKRKKEIFLTVDKPVFTELYYHYRKLYPKRREIVYNSSIDSEGFEIETEHETIIDPLDLNATDFPSRFPKELYEKLKNEYLADKKNNTNQFFIDSYVKFKASLLFTKGNTITDIVKIEPETIAKYKEQFKETITHDINNKIAYKTTIKDHYGQIVKEVLKESQKEKLIAFNKQETIKKLTPAQIFEKGLYDKNNIFHLFASVKYLHKLKSERNERVIIRLYDYLLHAKPQTDIKYYNREWIISFLRYVNDNGYANINMSLFNPFTSTKTIFKGKKRQRHTNASLNNTIISFKQVAKHLTKLNLLPANIDYSLITLADIREGAIIEAGKKSNNRLLLSEYEKIQNLKLNKAAINDYIAILDQLHSQGKLKANKTYKKLNVSDIERYREVFCFSVWLGGLRGIAEYNSVQLKDYDNEQIFRIYQNKVQKNRETKKYIDNPHNRYTKLLLKRNGGVIPKIEEKENKKYNAVLKLIGHLAKLEREFDEGKTVKDEISMYWQRKTFVNILTTKRVRDQDIMLFTGHAGKDQMQRSYKDYQNIELKRDVLKEVGLL